MTLPHYWQKGCDFLSQKNSVMKKLIENYKGEGLIKKELAFYTLARALVGQQISVKAAESIWTKLTSLIEAELQADKILKIPDNQLRNTGLSWRKVEYLKNIARCVINEFDNANNFQNIEEEIVIKKLSKVKGIGPWTIEMFLIFHMQSPDIFPIKDIGLINAINKNFKIDENQDLLQQHAKIGNTFKPYRTIATWYLWRSIDPVPVEY